MKSSALAQNTKRFTKLGLLGVKMKQGYNVAYRKLVCLRSGLRVYVGIAA